MIAGRRGSYRSQRVWTPVIDALSIMLFGVAAFTFLYFAVGYRYFETFFRPAVVMLAMLTYGIASGITLVGARVEHSEMSIAAVTAGILSALGLLALQIIVNTMMPAMGGVVVDLSPFWIVLFYASVGTAEEAAFTLSLFGSMVRAGINFILAAILKSVMFIAYHNFVAIELFARPVFEVRTYALILYVGSFFLTMAFYYTKHFSVPAVGHAVLNAIVMIRSLSGG